MSTHFTNNPRALEAVVIGAGHAGLATSYHLSKRGIEHLVLERNTPGHSWRTKRWNSFRLNTSSALTSLPGMPFKPNDPAAFETAASLAGYFDQYITAMKLPVRSGCGVTALTRDDASGSFSLACSGETGVLTAKNIVVATGIQNVPLYPAAASQVPAGTYSCHTASYRNPRDLPDGAVLIVGSGQSGCQVAEELLEAGRDVFIATSKVGRGRRFYRGKDILDWLTMAGFFRHRPEDLQDPAEQFAHQPTISGVNGGHTVGLQSLKRMGAQLCGRLESFEGHIARFRGDLGENVQFGDTVSAKILGGLDQFIVKSGIEAPPRETDPADEPAPELYDISGPAELDLKASGVSAVIWATGFTGDFSFLQVGRAKDKNGLPVHREGASPVPGLYFAGFPWLRTRGSGIVLGVNDDVEIIASHIAERIAAAG